MCSFCVADFLDLCDRKKSGTLALESVLETVIELHHLHADATQAAIGNPAHEACPELVLLFRSQPGSICFPHSNNFRDMFHVSIHFHPPSFLHSFSTLSINFPSIVHQFSMSCPHMSQLFSIHFHQHVPFPNMAWKTSPASLAYHPH